MSYLEEAAAELRKARGDNEKRAAEAGRMHTGMAAIRADTLREVNARRIEISAGLTRLAAIEAGLPPCLGHVGGGDKDAPE